MTRQVMGKRTFTRIMQLLQKIILTMRPTEQRLEHFEMNFIRFLHLLAHHPDFQLTEEAMPDIAK